MTDGDLAMTEDPHASEATSTNLLDALQTRANALLAKLRAYQACLQAHSAQKEVEIRTFKRGVESEVKTLDGVSSSKDNVLLSSLTQFETEELESKRFHALRSSNLPFYEAVWTVAIQCTAIVALGRRVYCDATPPAKSNGSTGLDSGDATRKLATEKKSAVVDVVAQDGLEWIKVSTITEKRLLFEMAKEGWEAYGDYSDSEDSASADGSSFNVKKPDDSSQLELVKLAKVLYAASRQDRVRFRHPHVRFVLPNIQEGLYEDVDAVIAEVRSIGVQVTCGKHDTNTTSRITESLGDLVIAPPNEIESLKEPGKDMKDLLPSPSFFSPPPTQTLNVDCTILLALISDISHIPTPELPPYPNNMSGHYHKAITRQIDTEATCPMLPKELYPYLSRRRLVCTAHAAQRMREIVQTMGTETEAARADLFLGQNSYHDTSADEIRVTLRDRYSCHDVPFDVALPIQIVDFDYTSSVNDTTSSTTTTTDTNTDIMRRRLLISPKLNLSPINASVFMYGWIHDLVTVTSNRAVANGLVKCINEILNEFEETQLQVTGVDRRMNDGDSSSGVGGGDSFGVGGGGGFVGPRLYVCETARSLIGKEKLGGHGGGSRGGGNSGKGSRRTMRSGANR